VSIIIFIVVLAILVLVHEFGHFWVAKKSGMKVDEFGFGFPPRLFGFKRGETLYSVNLFPLGGFVKIVGENNEEEQDPRSFVNKSFFARFATLFAGVFMNFILAGFLLAVGFMIGLPTVVPEGQEVPRFATISDPSVSVLMVQPQSPAADAGLKEGDTIKSADGIAVNEVEQFINHVKSKPGQNVALDIQRGNENLSLNVFSRENPPEGSGPIGISLGNVGRITYPWWYTPIVGFQSAWRITVLTVQSFGQLIFRGEGLESLGGPVKIASMTGQVTKLGIEYLIQFAAFLSINLAVLNIVPFPALDGGRILFLFIEKIRGKKNNPQIEQWANLIGFALLITLIVWITVRDVVSLV
jgi:regulator of sigma E protease